MLHVDLSDEKRNQNFKEPWCKWQSTCHIPHNLAEEITRWLNLGPEGRGWQSESLQNGPRRNRKCLCLSSSNQKKKKQTKSPDYQQVQLHNFQGPKQNENGEASIFKITKNFKMARAEEELSMSPSKHRTLWDHPCFLCSGHTPVQWAWVVCLQILSTFKSLG